MPAQEVELDRTRDDDPVRVCGECRRAKTIRGVWYLVPGARVPFVCETCFTSHGQATAHG